ncbi:MAG: glycoside hydrolase family 2 protein, partial [bacterium]
KEQLVIYPDSSFSRSATRQIVTLNGRWQARKEGQQNWTDVWVPGAYDFEGMVHFKRSFLLDSSFVGHTFKLVAFGINNRCTISLNGEVVTNHEGGHTPFAVGLDGHALFFDKENEIQISVDNSRHPKESLPLQHSPQVVRNLGGIFRDLYILAVPKITIDAIHLKPVFQENYLKGQLSVKSFIEIGAESSQDKSQLTLQMRLFDPDTQRPIAHGSENIQRARGAIEKEMTLDVGSVKPWTPDVPKLYILEISIFRNRQILDEVRERIGFSEFRIQERSFFLNGQPFILKGVDWVEDYGSIGATAGWEQIEREIQLIKGLGANIIRVIGTPPHPYFFDLCDRLGMLVFVEIPLSLVPEARFRNADFSGVAGNYFKETVAMGANHPCTAAWGLGVDYSTEQAQTRAFLNGLRQVTQERSNRPLYLVSRFLPLSLPSSVDFGLWEFNNKSAAELFKSIDELVVNKPVAISFGYTIARTMHPDSSDQRNAGAGEAHRQAQEIHADKIGRVLTDALLTEKTAGFLVHTFNDWRQTSATITSGAFDDAFLNRTGLVDLSRQKRVAYEVVKKAFTGKKVRVISQHFK